MPSETSLLVTTPLGPLRLTARGGRLAGVAFAAKEAAATPTATAGNAGDAAVLRRAAAELADYFAGRRREFSLPLDLTGCSPFRRAILETLRRVPCGEVLTYGELAARAGFPGAARAVGRVMASNPLPIVIPCHRVVAAAGRLGGYSGGEGTRTKERLLDLERQRTEKAADSREKTA